MTDDEYAIILIASNVKDEVLHYSHTHPNDFGVFGGDGRDRIPMKKLMKLFEIKKKSSQERQNLFRSIVNDICDLELIEGVGKVLVLKELLEEDEEEEEEEEESESEEEEEPEDYGYGDAPPTVQDIDIVEKEKRETRFRPPAQTMSSATADAFGVYTEGSCNDNNNEEAAPTVRRQGYRRRGSVTRYSIVAQDAVVDEYKKHEDVINQFRSDSKKIGKSLRSLNINDNDDSGSAYSGTSGKSGNSRGRQQQQQPELDANGNSVSRFFRRGRFSLAF